jgi:hypothetical protein
MKHHPQFDERDDYDDEPRRPNYRYEPLIMLGIGVFAFIVVVVPFLALVLFLVAVGGSNM